MTLSEYVDALRRGWIIILATSALALAAGTAYVLRQPEVYTSSASLIVVPEPAGGEPAPGTQRAVVADDRVKSYVAVVQGDVVRERVDEALGGIGDAGVSVVVPLDTVVLAISVTSGDPERAAEVAATYADVATDVIKEIETPADGVSRVTVTTVDRADVPSAPIPVPVLPVIGAAGILGLGLGVTLAVLRDVLRRERAHRPDGAPSGTEA